MPRRKTPEERFLIARRKRTAGDRRIAATHNTLALRRRRRTPPPPVIERLSQREQEAQTDLAAPRLVESRATCPRGWWERLLAWLWRRFERPPRRLYAESWSAAMAVFIEQYQVQRWRPLEVYRVRRLP